MLIQTWADVLSQSFQEVWTNFVVFVPNIVIALVILTIGWIVGAILGRLVKQLVDALKIDSAIKSAGLDEFASRGGFKVSAGGFLGWLVKWFIIIVFFVTALEVLGLSQVTIYLQSTVLLFLPKVIVSVLILLISVVIAEFVRDVIIGAARTAGVSGANFLGGLARWAILIFAFLAALGQLGVASAFLQTLFGGVVVAMALAFGLAFGLGGKEAAARFLEKLRNELNHGKGE